MNESCERCGSEVKGAGHMCGPCRQLRTCRFCGAQGVDHRHVCKDKLPALAFVCDGCGRVADAAEALCKPAKIV